MNELVTIENINPLVLFTPKAMDPLLADITKKAEDFEADVSTAKGRDKIRSMANKVAGSKTFLDKLGKDLNDDARQQINATDAERRKMRDYLVVLKAKIRKPLTDWEEEEEERIAIHKANLEFLTDAAENIVWDVTPLESLQKRLADVEASTMGDEDWEEFAGEAAEAKDAAINAIKKAITKREAKDAQDAEMERLRQEAEKLEREKHEAEEQRQQKEHDDLIRKEAEEAQKRAGEERATKVAEEAEEARQAAIREKEEAEERERAAEQRRKDDAEQAERDKELAVLRERTRIEDEERAKREAERKREADVKHRRTINAAAKNAFVQAGLSKKMAEAAVTVIAGGGVPNVRISY